MTAPKYYLVGGHVRDLLMERMGKHTPSRNTDIDYAVVADSYEDMVADVASRGKIYIERPEYMTVRARMWWAPLGTDVDADFTLCRKDGFYADGRRPESTAPGTLEDDLARRDFTCNAIAIDEDSRYIDPHGGLTDIARNILRPVGSAIERFQEDSLRMIRAVRFWVTHRMILTLEIDNALRDMYLVSLLHNVSIERVRDEMYKMFSCDTHRSLTILKRYKLMTNHIFGSRLWLMPTLKETR